MNGVIKQLDGETKKNIMDIGYNYNDVVIIDLSNYLYKNFYVHRNLSVTKNGFTLVTGHMYGVLRLLCTIKREFNNPAIILAVDGHDDERSAINPAYKANRGEKEYNIHRDTDAVLTMAGMLPGVFYSWDKKYEADDAMYVVSRTLDHLYTKNEIPRRIHIMTSDKDLRQAVNENIVIVKNLGKGKGKVVRDAEIVDIFGVKEEFNGVTPEYLAYYRAIVGDSGDNLNGYYRFPRIVAAHLAMNGVFGETCVTCDDEFAKKNDKWVTAVNFEYEIFQKNYAIMKLKKYPFTLKVPDITKGMETLRYYEMNSIIKEVEFYRSR